PPAKAAVPIPAARGMTAPRPVRSTRAPMARCTVSRVLPVRLARAARAAPIERLPSRQGSGRRGGPGESDGNVKREAEASLFIHNTVGSEQYAAADGAVDVLQLLQRQVGVLLVHVDDDVADLLVGLQELAADVDAIVGEDLVDLAHHTRNVVVDVQQ